MSVSKVFTINVEGITPILFNNEQAMVTIPKKDRKESYPDHEQAYWLHKAHLNSKDECYISSMWIFKTLITSQKTDNVPIKPSSATRAKATLQNTFVSCAYCDDAIVYKDDRMTTPVMKDDLVQFAKGVNRGTYSAPKKVIVVRPMTPGQSWYSKFTVTSTDNSITKEHIEEIFEWSGLRNGMGDWRPQRGGRNGMYRLLNVVEG